MERARKPLDLLPSRPDLTIALELALGTEEPDEEEPIQWWMIDEDDSEVPFGKSPDKEHPEPDDEVSEPIDPSHLEREARIRFLPKGVYCIKGARLQEIPTVNSYPHTPDGTSSTDTASANTPPSHSDPSEIKGETKDVIFVSENFTLSSEMRRQELDECHFNLPELFPDVQIKHEPIDDTMETAVITYTDSLSEPDPIPQTALATHKAEKHRQGGKACGIDGCTQRFTFPSNMKSHKAQKHGQGGNACDIKGCTKRFTIPSALATHQAQKHGQGGKACGIDGCTYSTTQSSNLKRHQRTHSGEKPYQCDHKGCTHSTTTSGNLKTHQLTHSGEKPFQCDHKGCSYSTTQKGNLKTHQLTHSGEKPFQCDHKGCSY